MIRQVFLGGASGETKWRREIAIPALDAAGVSWYDPQLAAGAWTPDREAGEMLAKDAAEVLLFVINAETRGVATVAEVAYYLGIGRQLALSIEDIPEDGILYGSPVAPHERDDLNRGRIFLRTMAAAHNVPVFAEVSEAVRHAIALASRAALPLTTAEIRQILAEVQFGLCRYQVEPMEGGHLLQITATEPDAASGHPMDCSGRKWFIEPDATRGAIVRTALKAALTWQEHETRERFTYRGKRIFGPHFEV
ncbi:MAG TPA: nucleoside 2-deoxyribosyltransferase domain-containing protein [Bryobacteraceae bacterium]|nr:nucleoside 2-deoxyribosyltransferase domain-containing protein [Bryobacteraceae bacterium]